MILRTFKTKRNLFQSTRRVASHGSDHPLPGILQHVRVQSGSRLDPYKEVRSYDSSYSYLPGSVSLSTCVGSG